MDKKYMSIRHRLKEYYPDDAFIDSILQHPDDEVSKRTSSKQAFVKVDSRSELLKEYESAVIELAKSYILKMQPLVEAEKEEDNGDDSLGMDQGSIACVIDEYFQRGFTVEWVLDNE